MTKQALKLFGARRSWGDPLIEERPRTSESRFIIPASECRIILAAGLPTTLLHPDWFMQNLLHFAGARAVAFPGRTGKTSFVDVGMSRPWLSRA